MPTHLDPLERGVPPPRASHAASAPASLVLFDGDVAVAWIAGRALGFGSFASERAAVDAAWVACTALAHWMRRRRREAPPLPSAPRLDVLADPQDGGRWVFADDLPIARLVDPGSVRLDVRVPGAPNDRRTSGAAGAAIGFEIAVPLAVGEMAVRRAAYVVYRALCRAGLLWDGAHAGRQARDAHRVAGASTTMIDGTVRRRHVAARRHAHTRLTPGATMSLSIFDHSDGRFRLVRDEREIGWVEGRTICFRGYPDAAAAHVAARAAYTALAGWSAWQLRAEPAPSARDGLSVRRDGAEESLVLGDLRIGRLRRFDTDDSGDDVAASAGDVGFEIDLPIRIAGALALSAAQIIDRALQAHRAEVAAFATGDDGAPVGEAAADRSAERPVERPLERHADRASRRRHSPAVPNDLEGTGSRRAAGLLD